MFNVTNTHNQATAESIMDARDNVTVVSFLLESLLQTQLRLNDTSEKVSRFHHRALELEPTNTCDYCSHLMWGWMPIIAVSIEDKCQMLLDVAVFFGQCESDRNILTL